MATNTGNTNTSNGNTRSVRLTSSRSGGTITWKAEFLSKYALQFNNLNWSRSGASSGSGTFSYHGTNIWVTISTWTTTVSRGSSHTQTVTASVPAVSVTPATTTSVTLTESYPAGKPSKPDTPTVNTITSSGAKVNWVHPSNNGATLLEYQVQRATNSGFSSDVNTTSNVTGTTRTLSGLSSNTTYYVRIRVRNSVGWSDWSSGRSFKTLAVSPSAPGAPTVSNVASTTATGTVTAPSNGGASITEYGWQVGTSTAFTTVVGSGSTGTTRTWNVTGLTASTTYYMRVRAKNSIGWSSWSSARSFSTVANSPGNVSAVSVSRTSDTSHNVTWTNNPTGAAPYTAVEVWRRDNVNTTLTRLTSLSATTTSYRDTSTVADREYVWRIVAVNASGSATGVNSSTQRTTPLAPSNATASRSGSDVIVRWTNQASYTHTVQIQVAHNGTWQTGNIATLSSTATSWSHTYPNPAIVYRYRVRAVSSSPTLNSAYSTTDIVELESPPNAPSVRGPNETQQLDQNARLLWVHNPTDSSEQQQYRIRHRRLGTSTWTTHAIVVSTNEYMDLPLTDYSDNDVVEWQVMTWGSHSTGSPWSNSGQFSVASIPTVAITSPPTNLAVPTSPLQWTYFDSSGNNQISFEYEIRQGSVVVYSAALTGSVTTQSVPFTYEDGQSYTVRMRVRSATGLYSNWVSRNVNVAYPTPAPPYITATWRASDGAARVKVHNPRINMSPVVNEITNPKPERRSTDIYELLAENLSVNPSFEYSSGTGTYLTNRLVGSLVSHGGSFGWQRNAAGATISDSIPDYGARWWFNSTGPTALTYLARGNTTVGEGSVAVTPGEVVSARMEVTNESSWYVTLHMLMMGNTATTPLAGTARITHEIAPGERHAFLIENVTIPADTTSIRIGLQSGGPGTEPIRAGTQFFVHDGSCINSGVFAPTLIHGNMIESDTDSDVWGKWAGTTDRSESTAHYNVPASTSYNYTLCTLSRSWSSDRESSLRIATNPTSSAPTTTSTWGVLADSSSGMLPSRWTHIRARVRQADGVTGRTVSADARRLALRYDSTTAVTSAQLPLDRKADQVLSLTAFVPASATSIQAIAVLGTRALDGPDYLWVDDLVILQATTEADLQDQIALLDSLGGYFDGENETDGVNGVVTQFRWTDRVDQSTALVYRDGLNLWTPSEPTVTNVGYAVDDLGADVWEFYKPDGISSASFSLPDISVSGAYVTTAADVNIVRGASNTRASYGVTGIDGNSTSVSYGEGNVRVTHHGTPTESTVTPTVTVRGMREAVVYVKRMTLVQGPAEDDYGTVYFDGDDPGASWNGTPGDATSTLTTRARYSLLTNPSFESGTTGWTISNLTATTSTSSTYVAEGSTSLRLQPAATPDVNNPGRLTSTSRTVVARQAVSAGIRVTSGSTTTAQVRVVLQFLAGGSVMQSVTSDWFDLTYRDIQSDGSLIYAPPAVAPPGVDTVRIRLETSQATSLNLYADAARIMLASDVTTAYERMWEYFDSTTSSHVNKYGYTVTYSVDSNRQRELWGSTQQTVYNDIYRRIDDGPWKLVETNVPVNGTIDDYQAGVGTVVEYRAEAVTVLPSRIRSDIARLLFPSEQCVVAGAYLSGSAPNFKTVAGLRYNLNVTESSGRAVQQHYWFSGESRPITISTPAINRAVTVSGTVVLADEAAGGVFQDVKAWRKLSTMVSPLLYRDDTGRVIYGTVSNFSIKEDSSYAIQVSFTVTETGEI